MKAQFFILSLILLVITSCSKKDEATPANSTQKITIGSKDYTFKGAAVIDYGYDSDYKEYNLDFVIASDEMTSTKKLSSYTHVLYLETYSSGSQFLPGSYSLDESAKQYGTISLFENGSFSTLQSGSFTITKGSGTQYTISIDGTLAGSSKIKGTYTGNFPTLSDDIIGAVRIGESVQFKIK